MLQKEEKLAKKARLWLNHDEKHCSKSVSRYRHDYGRLNQIRRMGAKKAFESLRVRLLQALKLSCLFTYLGVQTENVHVLTRKWLLTSGKIHAKNEKVHKVIGKARKTFVFRAL